MIQVLAHTGEQHGFQAPGSAAQGTLCFGCECHPSITVAPFEPQEGAR